VTDGHIHIEKINERFLGHERGTPAEYGARERDFVRCGFDYQIIVRMLVPFSTECHCCGTFCRSVPSRGGQIK
jgi:hypothetical protein